MKFTWKKAAALAAMAALTVSFAGCGGGDKKADDKNERQRQRTGYVHGYRRTGSQGCGFRV